MSSRLPSTRTKLLMKAREELSPDKSLAAVDVAASRIVGGVSVAAALVTGFGLFTATELADVGWGWALPSILLSAIAAALALWATVPAHDKISPGDLEDIDRYFKHQITWRGGYVRTAALLFALALLTAPLPVLVAAVDDPPESLDVSAAQDGDKITFKLAAHGLDADSTVRILIAGPRPKLLLVAEVSGDESASATASLPVADIGAAREATVEVREEGHPASSRTIEIPAS